MKGKLLQRNQNRKRRGSNLPELRSTPSISLVWRTCGGTTSPLSHWTGNGKWWKWSVNLELLKSGQIWSELIGSLKLSNVWSSLAYESAEQKHKHCLILTRDFLSAQDMMYLTGTSNPTRRRRWGRSRRCVCRLPTWGRGTWVRTMTPWPSGGAKPEPREGPIPSSNRSDIPTVFQLTRRCSTGWSNRILHRKSKCSVCCLVYSFLILLQHLEMKTAHYPGKMLLGIL